MTAEDTQWMDSASCQTTDPDLFYPTETGKWNKLTRKAAFLICDRCPVKIQCLTWAFETRDAHAILGGTTPEMRARIRREAA